MSKIGKKPIIIPEGVAVELESQILKINGPKGSAVLNIPAPVMGKIKDRELIFTPLDDSKQTRATWGTIRSLTQNAINGVVSGFEKKLIIEGVGFRANMEGQNIVLSVGYSHPIKYEPPQGIKIAVEKNIIIISGINKDLVGKVAAKIRSFKRAEPYKGKGIRYEKEIVRRKAGKKVATAAAK